MVHGTTDAMWLDILRRAGGYYECPKDANGKRLGPLVGYAGRDDQGRQYVGEVYANFAAIERRGAKLKQVAFALWNEVEKAIPDLRNDERVCVVGLPMGGLALASAIAVLKELDYYYPEKEVLELPSSHSRGRDRLVFKRHEPRDGDRVVLVEDVFNNFSTTDETVELVESGGAEVVALAGFLNRSDRYRDSFPVGKRQIPIVSLVHKPFGQWQQDDPAVAKDVQTKNVVWKPKHEWDRLADAMQQAA